jgi:hypothetical protein
MARVVSGALGCLTALVLAGGVLAPNPAAAVCYCDQDGQFGPSSRYQSGLPPYQYPSAPYQRQLGQPTVRYEGSVPVYTYPPVEEPYRDSFGPPVRYDAGAPAYSHRSAPQPYQSQPYRAQPYQEQYGPPAQ